MKTTDRIPQAPVLQRTPLRTAEGRELRGLFRDHPILVDGNYSDLEVAIMKKLSLIPETEP